MDSTVSVSKGVFLYNNGWKKPIQQRKSKHKEIENLDKLYSGEVWYESYRKQWSKLENEIKKVTTSAYNQILTNLVEYVNLSHANNETEFDGAIPTATLLTGINQPDHFMQFQTLYDTLREEVTPHVAMVCSQDAPTLKSLIEHVVSSFLIEDKLEICEDASPTKSSNKRLRNCNITMLKNWYNLKYLDKKKKKQTAKSRNLVIIIQDFESFGNEVLQDFVSILSCYSNQLPFVLVFGVATSASVLHKCLPYHVSSKLLIKIFQSRSSADHLNQIVQEIILSPDCPFHLSGKVFQLLIDVFLFYDFSVSGFIQSFKYCMMEHYFEDNTKALCCDVNNMSRIIRHFTHDDLENIRRLNSFRPYVEKQDCRKRIALLEDDKFFMSDLEERLYDYHEYLKVFHIVMRIFHVFIEDIPKKPYGSQIRELYAHCCSTNITNTPEFQECLQLITFQSKENLIESVTRSLKLLNMNSKEPLQLSPLANSPKEKNILTYIRVQFSMFLRQLQNANLEHDVLSDGDKSGLDHSLDGENTPITNRSALKKSLYKATKHEKVQSEFELVRSRLKHYLMDVFESHLQPLTSRSFHELFMFKEMARVKRHVIGAPRGAIHNALNNPAAYLQCSCCEISSSLDMKATFPDVCIAYKLHAECGKHINLYDWLQAFVAVLQPEHCDENRVISPELQVRFTRAVSELQFLGFIKASTRKTDHVLRLTW